MLYTLRTAHIGHCTDFFSVCPPLFQLLRFDFGCQRKMKMSPFSQSNNVPLGMFFGATGIRPKKHYFFPWYLITGFYKPVLSSLTTAIT